MSDKPTGTQLIARISEAADQLLQQHSAMVGLVTALQGLLEREGIKVVVDFDTHTVTVQNERAERYRNQLLDLIECAEMSDDFCDPVNQRDWHVVLQMSKSLAESEK